MHRRLYKDMRVLHLTLYDNSETNRFESLSVVIQLHNQASGNEPTLSISAHGSETPRRTTTDVVALADIKHDCPDQVRPPPSSKHLRPTDRLVLNALRARVPEGGQVTQSVRLQELIEECAISRRQVQICLKRLTESGLIERLLEGVSLGSSNGYSYKISQDILKK